MEAIRWRRYSETGRDAGGRDAWIGWDAGGRERNLPLVVNNARFLILPWVRIPNLASHIPALSRRQVREDWQARYKLCPVLMESFTCIPRFTGTVYKAAGWVHVGTTQGRGKYDRLRVVSAGGDGPQMQAGWAITSWPNDYSSGYLLSTSR